MNRCKQEWVYQNCVKTTWIQLLQGTWGCPAVASRCARPHPQRYTATEEVKPCVEGTHTSIPIPPHRKKHRCQSVSAACDALWAAARLRRRLDPQTMQTSPATLKDAAREPESNLMHRSRDKMATGNNVVEFTQLERRPNAEHQKAAWHAKIEPTLQMGVNCTRGHVYWSPKGFPGFPRTSPDIAP